VSPGQEVQQAEGQAEGQAVRLDLPEVAQHLVEQGVYMWLDVMQMPEKENRSLHVPMWP
jgi:hypothetical protein